MPCPHCNVPINFCLPLDIVDDLVRGVEGKRIKEPCRCGMTEAYRSWRTAAFLILAITLSLLGSCWFSHYYTTKQVELMKDRYEIQKRFHVLSDNDGLDFEVIPRQLPKK